MLSKEDLQEKLKEMKRLIDEQKLLQNTLAAKQTLQPRASISQQLPAKRADETVHSSKVNQEDLIQTEEDKMSSVKIAEERRPTVSQAHNRIRSQEDNTPPKSPQRRRLVPVELTNRQTPTQRTRTSSPEGDQKTQDLFLRRRIEQYQKRERELNEQIERLQGRVAS